MINGWYRVLNIIGHGSFGAVYEAEVIARSAIHIALKETIHPDHLSIFQTEFAALRQIKHENLPRYRDVFEAEGRGYLVMDFVPGQSLYDIIRSQAGPVLERLVISYGTQICDVLEHLHGQNPPILHRDIKPHNIRLTPEGLIKLVDFGMVKLGVDSTEREFTRGGSLPYAPLEQWIGGTDQRSDIYSLGATLYHLLTGRAPVPPARRQGVTPDPLVHPRELNPRLSPLLAESVLAAMRLDRTRRYQSAADLRSDLLDAAQQSRGTNPVTSIPGVRQPGTTPLSTPLVYVAPPPAAISRAAIAPRPGFAPAVTAALADTLAPVGRLMGHSHPVRAMAWGARSGILATGGGDGRIVLWSGRGQLRQERALTAGASDVFGLAWRPDDQILASAGRDQAIQLWRPGTGGRRDVWTAHTGAVYALAWSPCGTYIASAGWDKTVRIWRADDRSLNAVCTGHHHNVVCLCWSPDSTALASGSLDGTVRIWEVTRGDTLTVLSTEQRAVTDIAWSPNGDLIATGGADSTIRLWRLSGMLVETLRHHQAAVSSVQWGLGGASLVGGYADGSLNLWHLSGSSAAAHIRAHSARVNALAWSPDGGTLASASDDQRVLLWQLAKP